MVLVTPKVFEIQPDEKPPIRPPSPKSIMSMPRSFCPSVCSTKLWIQAGNQDRTAHNPISMEPNRTVPCTSSRLYCLTSSILDILEAMVLDFFQSSDSLRPNRVKRARTNGIAPNRNPSLQLDSRLIIPEENIPIGNPMDTIPMMMFLVSLGQTSDNKVTEITMMPPAPNPAKNLWNRINSQELTKLIKRVNSPKRPRERANDRTRPVVSASSPQENPPMVHPKR